MHARIAKEELAILLPTTMSHYFQDDHMPVPEVRRAGLMDGLRAVVRWFAEMPKRHAVMEELSMLSDHELADIGLTRGELPRVFDPAFAADRDAQRSGAQGYALRSAGAF